MDRARAAVILAAGQGTRMNSDLPKVLHPVGGRPMLDWAVAAARGIDAARKVIVVGAHSPSVHEHAAKLVGAEQVAVQDPPAGTAHAVRAAEQALAGFDGDVLVFYADGPLIRAENLDALVQARARCGGIAVLAFRASNPLGYGRLITNAEGQLERIVEERDASAEERAVTLCNSGVLCADAKTLFRLLSLVRNDNAKREYYLTDIVALARAAGFGSAIVEAVEADVLGVNSKAELARAEAIFQDRMRSAAMADGVTLIDPTSVFFSYDTQVAADVVIEPNVYFGASVKIAKGARISAFCHIEGADIGEGANVGPFARIRPGTKLGPKVKIGNFVELKNATFGEKAKASHLSYVGDADVGPRANLGAGTITCNYDGFDKYRTTIGEEAFIGSDTSLVAPVKVGARAYTGSGSVITKDVPESALAVARGKQRNVEGWADVFRAKKTKSKDAKP
jgi:bifunctional UDP-N-acetylglucosamine pyrophosphorylase/glucosamine-1-phosphate N-acetyltransferase